jgi:hypothetical protein
MNVAQFCDQPRWTPGAPEMLNTSEVCDDVTPQQSEEFAQVTSPAAPPQLLFWTV